MTRHFFDRISEPWFFIFLRGTAKKSTFVEAIFWQKIKRSSPHASAASYSITTYDVTVVMSWRHSYYDVTVPMTSWCWWRRGFGWRYGMTTTTSIRQLWWLHGCDDVIVEIALWVQWNYGNDDVTLLMTVTSWELWLITVGEHGFYSCTLYDVAWRGWSTSRRKTRRESENKTKWEK